MAPRANPEEVFTDLSGNPDGTPAAEADELERGLAALSRDKDEIPDDDLEVVDEDAEDGTAAAGAADGDEEGEEDEDGEAETGTASDFDPKDVQLLLAQAEVLDEREKAAKTAETQATADIAAARAKMKAAKEAGDTDGDIDATDAYTKATIALENAKAAVSGITAQKATLGVRAKELFAKAPKDADGNAIVDGSAGPTKKQREVAAEKPSKLVPKFKSANKWFGNAQYAKQQKRLLELDRGLGAEGVLSKNDPAYFKELGIRFNREFPGLYRDLDGKPIATGQRQRGSGAPIPGNGGGGAAGRTDKTPASKVSLVEADIEQMRKFNMDPDNMEHRRSWLAEKRSLAASGRA
jgi:hypothetical protein